MKIQCPSALVEATLTHLREAGRMRRECVMLWLGRRGGEDIDVIQAYRPLQEAQADMFHIPPTGMAALHSQLRGQRLMVAAQVHSHPFEAFHSHADDQWAIVRHEGALSLVVPYFASATTQETFFEHTKVFRFSAAARWDEVPSSEVQACLKIT